MRTFVTSKAIEVDTEAICTSSAGWAGAGYTGVALTEFTCFLQLPLELQRSVQFSFLLKLPRSLLSPKERFGGASWNEQPLLTSE
jgi:hypothetical protein